MNKWYMMDNERNQQAQKVSSGGISFCSLLTIVFITLKLIGKITWSWWWVLSPLWIPFAIVIGIIVIMLIAYIIVVVSDRNANL